MKSVTANFKLPSYAEEHQIFIGTHIGSLKSEFLRRFKTETVILCHSRIGAKE